MSGSTAITYKPINASLPTSGSPTVDTSSEMQGKAQMVAHAAAALAKAQASGQQLVPRGVETMGASDILAYVTFALGDIDGQLGDLKGEVQARQEKAADIRKMKALWSEYKGGNTSINKTPMDQAKYNEMMTLMDKYPNDPTLNTLRGQLADGFQSYTNLETGVTTAHTSNTDATLAEKEVTDIDKAFDESQAAVGDANELTMMNLQQLMQRRNQVTQFSSNALNVLNEAMKSVIGNIR